MLNRGSDLPLIAWIRRAQALGMKMIQFILSVLRNTDRPIPVYVWHAWLIDVVPCLLIAVPVLELLGPPVHGAVDPPIQTLMTLSFFSELVVKAPWTETLIMWPILFVLRLILGNTMWVPVASGLIWGNLHALGGLQWGVSQIWSFFVLSVCFLEWEKKSRGLAILVTGLLHMWANLVGFMLLFLVWILLY